jgi:hypothetical protein
MPTHAGSTPVAAKRRQREDDHRRRLLAGNSGRRCRPCRRSARIGVDRRCASARWRATRRCERPGSQPSCD